MTKHSLAILALLLICSNVLASSIGVPGTIYLYEEKNSTTITIENSESYSQNFELEAIFPTAISLSRESGTISANRGTSLTITIQPRAGLIGQTYEGKVIATIGEEEISRPMRIVFRKAKAADKTPADPEPSNNTGSATTGFFTVASPNAVSDLLLNAFLGLVAAILLIAFIARFTKRLEGH